MGRGLSGGGQEDGGGKRRMRINRNQVCMKCHNGPHHFVYQKETATMGYREGSSAVKNTCCSHKHELCSQHPHLVPHSTL